jgi:alpha-D-ribose 1-methylphosphonate 5-triphosphate synthase subunit PhnG
MSEQLFPLPPEAIDQSHYLSILCRAPAEEVKRFADQLIPNLGAIEVLHNRTGLIMASMADTAQGTTFYIGEVLVAEAHVRLDAAEGYAACLGHDLQQALAIALIDAAIVAGRARAQVDRFIQLQATALEMADQALLEQVALTHVEMETF